MVTHSLRIYRDLLFPAAPGQQGSRQGPGTEDGPAVWEISKQMGSASVLSLSKCLLHSY